MSQKVPTMVRLKPEIRSEIEKIAEIKNMSISSVIASAMEGQFSKLSVIINKDCTIHNHYNNEKKRMSSRVIDAEYNDLD